MTEFLGTILGFILLVIISLPVAASGYLWHEELYFLATIVNIFGILFLYFVSRACAER